VIGFPESLSALKKILCPFELKEFPQPAVHNNKTNIEMKMVEIQNINFLINYPPGGILKVLAIALPLRIGR
jgi:hypothetical protein